jgi:hypothetical protein
LPIFANRTIGRLLQDLASAFPPTKLLELKAELASPPDSEGPISAEWEVAVLSCLKTAGALAFPESAGRQPDLIFTSAATAEQAMVEITAISDKGLHEKNPIEDFSRCLHKITMRLRPVVGALTYEIGNREVEGEVVLGVPRRADMDAFFASASFRGFLAQIRKAPGDVQRYDFECRGSPGYIVFQPGAASNTGHYAAFDHINDVQRNHITSRLRKKDQQLRDSNCALPGIVVLCDGHCAVLKRGLRSPGKPPLEDVLDVFLNGREHQQAGPLLLQKGLRPATRRINAVVIIAAKENHDSFGPGVTRYFEVRYAFNRGHVYHPLRAETLEAICDSLQKNLPPIRTSPINARTTYPYPPHYQGWSLKAGSHGTVKIKISLLALQGLLNGTIKQADFLRDHRDFQSYMLKFLVDGRMISKMDVERCPDEDDDWVHIEFSERDPKRMFAQHKKV